MGLITLMTIIAFGFTILLSFLSLFYAVIKQSWKAMLICFIASLPLCLYVLGGNPPISFIGLLPLFFLILTVYFRKRSKKAIMQ